MKSSGEAEMRELAQLEDALSVLTSRLRGLSVYASKRLELLKGEMVVPQHRGDLEDGEG